MINHKHWHYDRHWEWQPIKARKIKVLEFIDDKETVTAHDLVNEFGYTYNSARCRLSQLRKDGYIEPLLRGQWCLANRGYEKIYYLRSLKEKAEGEKREQELSRRIKDMEPRAQKAETTLAALREEIQKLQDTGLPSEELAEFSQKIQAIARRHNIKPLELRNRLLQELETLDKGLGLEVLIQSRQQELDKQEQAISEAKGELETAKVVVAGLKQEKTNLEASIRNTREKVGREIAKITPLARDTIK